MPDRREKEESFFYRFFKEADQRYAMKIFERAFIVLISAIVLGFLTALITKIWPN